MLTYQASIDFYLAKGTLSAAYGNAKAFLYQHENQ